MRRARRLLPPASIALGVMLAAAGCASQGAPAPVAPASVIDTTTFAPDLAVDLRRFTKNTAGMYLFDVATGSGVVASEGRKVTFRYAAFLPSGAVVETQRDPIEAELGPAMVRGLRLGLAGMRVGGIRRLVVPPALAYGRTQYGKIPPNSILVFDVELIAVR